MTPPAKETSVTMRFSSNRRILPPIAIALACLGAQNAGQPTKFDGRSIPDPPAQKEPWTPPQTKLPRFLLTATSALFDQGVADPRGCEYREVEVLDGRTYGTHAFVLPERPGETRRFAVGWDGEIYPAASVGPAVNLDADVRDMVDSIRTGGPNAGARVARGQGNAAGFGGLWGRHGRFGPGGPPGLGERSALKVCLLLRLGRADLAEKLFAAATTWTPEIRGRDFTDYHVNYLRLAQEWATGMYLRLVDAHMRGDDVIALDTARRLSAFVKAAQARAKEMGFEWDPTHGNGRAGYFPFLRQLPELLADQERRASEPPRGPIPPRGADPAARVAALIRDLDQIAQPQQMHFGNTPVNAPQVLALEAEGEAAVEPLLAAIENDTRLTRTVSFGRGSMSIDRRVYPVLEAEVVAVRNILGMHQFPGEASQVEYGSLSRKDLARPMREFWEKNRGLSPPERWYRTLLDDSAGPKPWMEAAGHLIELPDPAVPAVFGGIRVAASRSRAGEGPMKGDVLRSRRNPSVSELIARRTLEIAGVPWPRSTPDLQLQGACWMALDLDRWDSKAALPVIQALTTQARETIDWFPSEGYGQHETLVQYIAQFSVIRARAGDRAAFADYVAEIRKWNPEKDQLNGLEAFEPMWTYPDDPAVREAARWLFNDPASPWAAFLRKPGTSRLSFRSLSHIYASPLLRSPGFREAVLAMMADRSAIGTARRTHKTAIQLEMSGGDREGIPVPEADLEGLAVGAGQLIRTCDYLAWQISAIEGAPRCELYWPQEQRDAAVAECVGFLKTYGDRFTAERPPGAQVPPFHKTAHLAFPRLDHPATRADVQAGRAIFSLEGEGDGEVRRVALPSLPIRAKWNVPAVDDAPAAVEEGLVWQAEEIRRGNQWERYYGFVGRHVIARVPAGSIDLAGRLPPAPGAR